MKILKIDGTVTVITEAGDVITATNVSDETFQKVHSCMKAGDIEGIKSLLVPELCAEEKKFIAKKKAVETIHTMARDLPLLFSIQNGALYRDGINISVPEELALAYVQAYENYLNSVEHMTEQCCIDEFDEFVGLDRFWMWCSLNPNAESRVDLFRFLKHHDMQITKQGMFLAYRRVVSKKTDDRSALLNFVSSSYIKVKAQWKKNPTNYSVFQKDGIYELKKDHSAPAGYIYLGNLQTLYLELPTFIEHQFTDAHTHSMDYRIGLEARIERHQGNQSNQVSCSKGLHIASKAYDYSGFGDTAILVAVNPMDVLAVPHGQDGKLRTCAFTPVAVLEEGEENQILAQDLDFKDILYTHYEQQVATLREMVEGNTAYELSVNHILNAPNQYMLDTILDNLESAEEIINSRTSYI